MSSMQPEEYLNILIRTLKYFVSSDNIEEDKDVKWMRETIKLMETGLNPFDPVHTGGGNSVLKLLNLLRESLLTQRWEEVLKLITFISKNKDYTRKDGTSYQIFTVGMELSYHLEPCRGRLLERLVHQLVGPTTLGPREVILEYVFFLLSATDTPDIEQAMNVLQTFKKPAMTKKAESRHMLTMFEAYKGLVRYMQWLISKQKIEGFAATADNFLEEADINLEEKNMKLLCERALTSFQSLRGQPGVWDIFITKYIQLLEWCDMLEEAEVVLREYQELNPDNPNAYRYLLQHYRKHGPLQRQLPILQSLCELLPSGGEVLEVVHYHRQNDASPSVTIPLLFNLLDYQCWKEAPEPWSLLAQDLIKCLESEVDETVGECLQQCWSSRYSWWPQYHFHTVTGVQLTADISTVLANKSVVAIIFGTAAEFVACVRQLLTDDVSCTQLLNRASEAAKQLQVQGVDDT